MPTESRWARPAEPESQWLAKSSAGSLIPTRPPAGRDKSESRRAELRWCVDFGGCGGAGGVGLFRGRRRARRIRKPKSHRPAARHGCDLLTRMTPGPQSDASQTAANDGGRPASTSPVRIPGRAVPTRAVRRRRAGRYAASKPAAGEGYVLERLRHRDEPICREIGLYVGKGKAPPSIARAAGSTDDQEPAAWRGQLRAA